MPDAPVAAAAAVVLVVGGRIIVTGGVDADGAPLRMTDDSELTDGRTDGPAFLHLRERQLPRPGRGVGRINRNRFQDRPTQCNTVVGRAGLEPATNGFSIRGS
jgi:hypothetical protein